MAKPSVRHAAARAGPAGHRRAARISGAGRGDRRRRPSSALVPIFSGLVVFFDPLRRKRRSRQVHSRGHARGRARRRHSAAISGHRRPRRRLERLARADRRRVFAAHAKARKRPSAGRPPARTPAASSTTTADQHVQVSLPQQFVRGRRRDHRAQPQSAGDGHAGVPGRRARDSRQVRELLHRQGGKSGQGMKSLLDWLDDRTGVRDFVHEALFERIPGGAAGATCGAARWSSPSSCK